MFHIIINIVIKPTNKNTAQFVKFSVGKFSFVQFPKQFQWCSRLFSRPFQWKTKGNFNPKTHIIFVGGCLRLCNSVSLTSLWVFIQGDGRKFLDRFKSYFVSQISQLLNEIHICRITAKIRNKRCRFWQDNRTQRSQTAIFSVHFPWFLIAVARPLI